MNNDSNEPSTAGLFDLSGKVAVVTGSSRGLGYAIAEAMIAYGATVIVSSESAEDTAAAARALGERAVPIPCDVSDDAAVIALVAQMVERFGGIDILVSNAGIQGGPSADPLDMTVFDRVIAVNLRSMAVLTKHSMPHMAGRAGASVILIASISALRGNAKIDAYALAKAGVAQLARNLAVQWGPKGVRANAIAPGLIDTKLADHLKADKAFMERRMQMTPLRRMGEPHEIAGVAVFLAAPASGFVNGQVIVADGGTVITDGS